MNPSFLRKPASLVRQESLCSTSFGRFPGPAVLVDKQAVELRSSWFDIFSNKADHIETHP